MFLLILMTILVTICVLNSLMHLNTSQVITNISLGLFPLGGLSLSYFISTFLVLALLNLISLTAFSYPVTTTLAFNLSAALSLWFLSMILLLNKEDSFSAFLPANSPWYLIPFLSIVELVSISVRPITLCFRLLANMSAGHILLSLICKMSNGMWMLGVMFGILELMVALVQAFVFLMLVSVYLEESLTH